jgi:hypothetical protein
MDNDETLPSPAGNPPGVFPPGKLIAGRFTIEALAGRGGMGLVYRAMDSRRGQRAALKLLYGVISPEVAYRFKREAVLLEELRHPGIVSYVTHGTTEEGQPFLAMDWLEGEDLARRLAREPLGLPETLALLRRVAEALATAHHQGIVHRDLKPSNLFLRGGRPEDAVLLDFGLARQVVSTLVGVTRSNMVLGTPGYMAPEQASSQSDLTPAADIFSLGCVLYECLTGRPPFAAPHFAAVLAKILFADPAPLHTLRPGLPPGLQALMDRMLAKDPKRRLPDAPSLLESLSALEAVPGLLPSRVEQDSRSASLTGAEQQLVSVLVASFGALARNMETQSWDRAVALRDSVRTTLAPHATRVELLADGSLLAALVSERGSATDQVALAARCALSFKERWPEAAVVLVTGLGVFNEHLPVGEVMDRAGRLLRQLEEVPSASALVVLDEVSAGLLGSGFQLSRFDSGTFLLQGEQLDADASRPLLGKPTPCVGREQELALLDLTLTTCIEEPAARALLVTAPAGVGKSRLRHEFLRRLERREQPVLVLLGRGDPLGAGASYSLLGQVLRRLCGIVEGEALEVRRARLHQRVAQHLPEARAQDVVEFLGELCAVPFPEEGSPRLRAARGDPQLMSAQVGRALVTFLGAECDRHPVLLVLEDLHWSEAFTVKLVNELLRALAERPFLVLALARPEVKELFPDLWARRLQELPLNGLSRKASARLVREVLGAQVPDAVVQKAVEQSDGNALFLEELIRLLAEGRGEAAPETVLAVLQARLMRMEPGARQVLLAASIFGRTFWTGGVRELLGPLVTEELLEKSLRELVEQEVIEPQPVSGFPSETEYRFRHALTRDAAYGLVPHVNSAAGHRMAGGWLERMGESDALVLAAHYQRGQRLERAAHFYTRAVERLFEQQELQGTLRCVEAALACGVSGEELNRLRAFQSMVAFWMGQLPSAMELGIPALEGLKAGSPLWCSLMGSLLIGSLTFGQSSQVARLSALLVRTTPEPEALTAYAGTVSMVGVQVALMGERQQTEALLGRLQEVVTVVRTPAPVAQGYSSLLESYFLHFYEARPWRALKVAEEGRQAFAEVGSEANALVLQTTAMLPLIALGEPGTAAALMREAMEVARRTKQHMLAEGCQLCLIMALAHSPEQGHRQEAHARVLECIGRGSAYPYLPVMHVLLARLTAADGTWDEAESSARKAFELLAPFRVFLPFARTVLSTLLLARGHTAEARQEAALGVRELEQMGSAGGFAVGLRLALAEACFAEGDDSAGEAALRETLRCVRARADDIPEAAARERFLRQVPENARTLELARQRWGESAA